jgi:hypothetical protein
MLIGVQLQDNKDGNAIPENEYTSLEITGIREPY